MALQEISAQALQLAGERGEGVRGAETERRERSRFGHAEGLRLAQEQRVEPAEEAAAVAAHLDHLGGEAQAAREIGGALPAAQLVGQGAQRRDPLERERAAPDRVRVHRRRAQLPRLAGEGSADRRAQRLGAERMDVVEGEQHALARRRGGRGRERGLQ